MGFNVSGAISGAGSGSAMGPYGAIAGGLLGGFMGGDEPELYDADDYATDMAPWKEMIDQQVDMSGQLMDPNSAMNRRSNNQIMGNSMDQMGLANTMGQRNQMQSGGGFGNSGLLQAAINNNMMQYSNQGLQQGRQNSAQMFNQGLGLQQTATNNMGDYQGGMADLNAGNVGTMNQYNQAQSGQAMGGLGDIFGNIAGTGATALKGGGTQNQSWGNALSSWMKPA